MELPLDREVFQASSPGEADLRMVQADGLGEVAYQLVAQSGRLERQPLQGKIRDLGHVADEHSTFVVDLGQTGEFAQSSRDCDRLPELPAPSDD